MADPDKTRWSLVLGAARGEAAAREQFARRYEPIVRAYLGARWRHSPLFPEMDDAVQDVFLDCFRGDGALSRADPERGCFRAFLHGVVRNIALRRERARHRARERPAGDEIDLDGVEGREERLSRLFDREWASRILEQAARLQAKQARERGEEAVRRVDLLALRFEEDLPIREIAKRWEVEPAWLHHQYALAREEYQRALRDVVREWSGRSDGDVEAECRRLLEHIRG